MKEFGLCSIVVRKNPSYKKGDYYKKFDNLIEQNFIAEEQTRCGVLILRICG